MLNFNIQETQPSQKQTNQTSLKTSQPSRNQTHTPTIEYMADRKKCSRDVDCFKDRIEAGTKSYFEGMSQAKLRQFLCDTNKEKNKYKWKGFKNLDFDLDNLNDSIGHEISRLVRIFNPNLLSLKITIRANNDTVLEDKDMEHFSQQIARHLVHLKEFYIMVVDCNSFTDKSVKTLIKQLTQYSFKLEKLELSFPSCLITDECLKSLLSNLGRSLKKLKQLKIYFSECKGITETGIKYLREDLKSCDLQSLEDLSLNFYWCFSIHNKNCFIELENDILQYLPKLKTFNLKQ